MLNIVKIPCSLDFMFFVFFLLPKVSLSHSSRAPVCVFHFFVITHLNPDPLLVALVHPPVEKSQFWLQSKRCGIRQGVTCWYAFYQDDLCKLCTLFPQESLFWKCQDKLPEISHKIHCAGSVRWRPPRSQGHWAAMVTLGLACLPHAWHSWLLKTSAQTDTLKPGVALSTSGRSAKQVLH